MMQLCLIMFLFAPAFASRGILTDPQGAEYAIDSPASWWRLEDVRGGKCPLHQGTLYGEVRLPINHLF